jgi:hypothetical protein
MPALAVVALFAILSGGQDHPSGQAHPNGKESVRIYVFASDIVSPDTAAEHTTPDEARQGRLTAVNELREALRRKAGLSVVDDREQADVIVEVTDREEQDAGDGGFGGIKVSKLATTTIRCHVTSGQHETDLKGLGNGTGSRAAKDAADRLLKWIVRNRLDR